MVVHIVNDNDGPPDLYQTYLTLLLINLVHILNLFQLIAKAYPQAVNSIVKFSVYLCVLRVLRVHVSVHGKYYHRSGKIWC